MSPRILVVLAALLTCSVAIPAASALDSERRGGAKIKVGDDFFSPSNLDVKKGKEVKFKWLSSNKNKHNATLTSGPSGVSSGDFTSKTGKTDVSFSPKFKKSGTYKFVCTIHPEMKAKVKAK